MSFVRIVHPDGMEADVPESAVPQHRASGWELADPPTPRERVRRILIDGGLDPDEADRVAAAAHPDEQTSGAPAESGAPSLEDQSPRGRRASKEGDK